MIPSTPHESQMTDAQRKALRRISTLLSENFTRGLITVVYRGVDNALHVQVVSNAMNKTEALDLGRRTMQQLEIAEQGIITTLTNSEKRIVQ